MPKPTILPPLFDASRSRLETGDLLLFSGRSRCSQVIQACTRSRYSHVAMIVRAPKQHEQVLLWESVPISHFPDVEAGKITTGVMLVCLSDRVKSHVGEIVVRRLECERSADLLLRLAVLQKELRGRPYERSLLQLVRAAYDGPFGRNEEDLSSIFCSELVAAAYQRMGLLPSGPGTEPANEYTPGDFAEGGKARLVRGALGPELPLLQLLHESREEKKKVSGELSFDLEMWK